MWVKRAAVSVVIVALSLGACASQHPDEPAVIAVLDKTIAALQKSDFDTLWALTDPASQAELIALVRQVHATLQRVPEVYGGLGEARVAEARAALGEGLVDTIFPDEERAGPKLLARLLAPDLMRFDGHAMDGLNNNDVTLDESHDPAKAIVHTSAGESFAFVKTDAGWRSLLVRDLILQSATIRALADSVAKVDQTATERQRAWREGRDPHTPEGAYNVARAALTEQPLNAKLLYSLLDDDAREAVLGALKRSRDAQRDVQRRTTRKQRRRAYEDAGLAIYVDAKSDRDLYARWARTEGWKAPLAPTDEPARVDGDLAQGRVEVVTVSEARVPMVRGGDGTWRIADQAPVLQRTLTAPFEAETPLTP